MLLGEILNQALYFCWLELNEYCLARCYALSATLPFVLASISS